MSTMNCHLKNVLAYNELQEDSVIRKFQITALDSKNHELETHANKLDQKGRKA